MAELRSIWDDQSGNLFVNKEIMEGRANWRRGGNN